jgi:hypothetical protein
MDLLEARGYDYAAKLLSHQSAFADTMRGLAGQLRSGALTIDQWHYRSQVAVQGHVLDGYRLGVAQAKGIAPSAVRLSSIERKAANQQIVAQFKYLAKFRDEIAARQATGKGLTGIVDARAAMYAGGSRDAFGAAQLAEKPEQKLTWKRHVQDSCATCIAHNGQSRTAAEWEALDVWPAHNVDCHSNCRCTLE